MLQHVHSSQDKHSKCVRQIIDEFVETRYVLDRLLYSLHDAAERRMKLRIKQISSSIPIADIQHLQEDLLNLLGSDLRAQSAEPSHASRWRTASADFA